MITRARPRTCSASDVAAVHRVRVCNHQEEWDIGMATRRGSDDQEKWGRKRGGMAKSGTKDRTTHLNVSTTRSPRPSPRTRVPCLAHFGMPTLLAHVGIGSVSFTIGVVVLAGRRYGRASGLLTTVS